MSFWNSLAFFYDLMDIGNLISGSSAFSKTSLNFCTFSVHVLLKPGLENFEHYFTSVWDECYYAVVWAFFGIAFLWDWNENCGHCWVFQMCWRIECNTLTEIAQLKCLHPLLALFLVVLPKTHLSLKPLRPPLVARNRFKKVLIGEVRECINKGGTIRKL